MARIILASGSPRRQELLQRMGLREFEISVPDVEEWYPPELVPEDIVAYISREKSQAVQAPADAIVITADTMVFLDDQRLGKPHDEAEALSMLTALSGRKHRVCTGVTVRQGEKALTRAQSTDVYFREASRQELLAYIRGGEPMDKAGAYGVPAPAGPPGGGRGRAGLWGGRASPRRPSAPAAEPGQNSYRMARPGRRCAGTFRPARAYIGYTCASLLSTLFDRGRAALRLPDARFWRPAWRGRFFRGARASKTA